jgi:hypothetical protein
VVGRWVLVVDVAEPLDDRVAPEQSNTNW